MATRDELAETEAPVKEQNPEGGGPHLQNPMPIDMLEPGDISDTVVFLASDAARYITGVTMPVDAGFNNKL